MICHKWEKKGGLWLRQKEHVCGHLWHRYSVTVNQVIMITVKLQHFTTKKTMDVFIQNLKNKYVWWQNYFERLTLTKRKLNFQISLYLSIHKRIAYQTRFNVFEMIIIPCVFSESKPQLTINHGVSKQLCYLLSWLVYLLWTTLNKWPFL